MEDMDDALRQIYASGVYDLSQRIYYTGYESLYELWFEYEWILVAEETTCIYRVDALTGEILSREVVERTP